MRHEGLVKLLMLLGCTVCVIGSLAAAFLFTKGLRLMENQYAGDTGMYFLFGALAIGALSNLLGAIGVGVGVLIQRNPSI